jgi:hypothetical protein
MKKVAVILISLLVVSMALMVVTPVLAKPNTVSLTAKWAGNGGPIQYQLFGICAGDPNAVGAVVKSGSTDIHGKVNIDISGTNWGPSTSLNVYMYNQGGGQWYASIKGSVTLSNQGADRVTILV